MLSKLWVVFSNEDSIVYFEVFVQAKHSTQFTHFQNIPKYVNPDSIERVDYGEMQQARLQCKKNIFYFNLVPRILKMQGLKAN